MDDVLIREKEEKWKEFNWVFCFPWLHVRIYRKHKAVGVWEKEWEAWERKKWVERLI
jgi:hypothetical protein